MTGSSILPLHQSSVSAKDVGLHNLSSLALPPLPLLPPYFLKTAARQDSSLKDTVFKNTLNLKADTTYPHTIYIPYIVIDSGEDHVF